MHPPMIFGQATVENVNMSYANEEMRVLMKHDNSIGS
jgi:hypothetical protein